MLVVFTHASNVRPLAILNRVHETYCEEVATKAAAGSKSAIVLAKPNAGLPTYVPVWALPDKSVAEVPDVSPRRQYAVGLSARTVAL